MTRSFLRFAALSLAFVCGVTILHAQSAKAVASSARVHTVVDVSQRQTLAPGSLPPWATAENDHGALAAGQRLDNLHLILARAPQVEAAFQQLLLDQQNPSSPRFHQWLTPQQNAEQYGIAPDDLAAVENWLTSQGLQVDNVAAGGVFITFSGTAAAVQNTFGTAIHTFTHGSTTAYAALSEPTVPAALGGVIRIVSGLSQEDAHIYSHVQKLDKPYQPVTTASGFQPDENFGSTPSHYLAPADFNTIYDVPSATTGTGVHAVVLISSRIQASDITGFNSYFGLNVAQPTQILLPGSSDPGVTVSGGEGEADLDVQRILGTAPGSSVDVLVFSGLSDTLIQSALQYETSTLNDPVVNMSFGSCAAQSSPSRATTYDTYYSALAAQGVSITVSSGDSAAGACETAFANPVAGAVASTNVLCASQWITCVGGTEFNDTASPSTYWASSNNATTKGSALSYIPEGAWDEPTTTGTSSGFQAAGSGGGVTAFTKPGFQAGTGVPADGFRDVPDVAFTSAYHVAYIICEADDGSAGNNCATSTIGYVTYGTSAAAPSMAGVATLLNQKTGARQGSLNTLLYQLATSTPAAFHDATPTSSGVTTCSTSTPSMCNNSDPGPTSLTGGVVGYPLQTGYDLATGLGSLDVNAFLTAAATVSSSFTVTPASLAYTLISGATTGNTDLITFASVNSFAGTVNYTCSATNSSGTAAGSCSLSPTSGTLAANGTTTSTLTITTTPGTSGVLNVTVTGTSGSTVVKSSTIAVTLTASSFTLTPLPNTLNIAAGATTGNTSVVTVASVNGFAGTVTIGCTTTVVSGSPSGTCAALPTSVVLTAGGSQTTTVTLTSTAGGGGVLTENISGSGVPTGGTIAATATASVTATLTIPTFTLAAVPATLNLTSGATTGNTSVVTFTSVNGFAGSVAVSCVATKLTGTAAGSCTATTPITLAANGTATSTITFTSTAGTSGTMSLAVTGTSGSTTASLATPIAVTLVTPGFTLTPATASISLISGATTNNTVPITVTSTNSLTGAVTLTCVATNASGTAAGSCVASPVTLTANGTATSTVTVTSTPGTSGTLSLAIGGTAGTVTATAPTPVVTATLTAASFTVSAGTAVSVAAGATTGTGSVGLTSPNLFAGTVSFTCTATNPTGTAAGTCSVAPATLTAGGTGTAVVTFTLTSLGTSGGLTLNITGTGTTAGATISTSASTTLAATVAAPSFSLSTPAALSINPSGATTGNTTSTTLTSTGFAGTVSFTCNPVATSGSPASPATCSASSVTLTSGGTATSTITVTSITAHAKQSQLAGLGGWGIKGGALLAVMLCLVPFRRRRFVRPLAAFALLAFGLAALSGCGGSSTPVKSSSDGNYTVTVTGTGTSTGASAAYTAAPVTFTLTISN